MKRYFIAFWKDGEKDAGHMGLDLYHYPSWRVLQSSIMQEFDLENCVITSVIELSEEDFNSWISVPEEDSQSGFM